MFYKIKASAKLPVFLIFPAEQLPGLKSGAIVLRRNQNRHDLGVDY
jgi:hypothetical protein